MQVADIGFLDRIYSIHKYLIYRYLLVSSLTSDRGAKDAVSRGFFQILTTTMCAIRVLFWKD